MSGNPRIRRYLVATEYIGTRFSVVQQQSTGRTVVGVLEVKLIVGTLKFVGTGDLVVSDVERILKAKTVTAASPMAPACGLYLASVKLPVLIYALSKNFSGKKLLTVHEFLG